MKERGSEARQSSHAAHYIRLAAMTGLSFLAMFVLMYSMVDRLSNVLPNLNQAYMAGLMTAPMVALEILLMWPMYPNRRLNAAVLALSVIMLGAFWFAIRRQAGITDEQFLRSMVPHHAGAILMCREAAIRDPEIERLCGTIVSSQQQEIDFMKAKLRRGVSR